MGEIFSDDFGDEIQCDQVPTDKLKVRVDGYVFLEVQSKSANHNGKGRITICMTPASIDDLREQLLQAKIAAGLGDNCGIG